VSGRLVFRRPIPGNVAVRRRGNRDLRRSAKVGRQRLSCRYFRELNFKQAKNRPDAVQMNNGGRKTSEAGGQVAPRGKDKSK